MVVTRAGTRLRKKVTKDCLVRVVTNTLDKTIYDMIGFSPDDEEGQLLETRIRYPCTECNHPYIFKTKKGLENHKKNKCKRNTPSDKDADLSKIKSERVRNIKPKDVVDRQLSCDICKFPYQYASVLTLNRHKKKCAEKQKAKSKQNDATQLKSTAQNMQSSEIINGVNVETMDLQNGVDGTDYSNIQTNGRVGLPSVIDENEARALTSLMLLLLNGDTTALDTAVSSAPLGYDSMSIAVRQMLGHEHATTGTTDTTPSIGNTVLYVERPTGNEVSAPAANSQAAVPNHALETPNERDDGMNETAYENMWGDALSLLRV